MAGPTAPTATPPTPVAPAPVAIAGTSPSAEAPPISTPAPTAPEVAATETEPAEAVQKTESHWWKDVLHMKWLPSAPKPKNTSAAGSEDTK